MMVLDLFLKTQAENLKVPNPNPKLVMNDEEDAESSLFRGTLFVFNRKQFEV
jgi:hypothetical protein